jgi:lambda family phage tail tape measure protein
MEDSLMSMVDGTKSVKDAFRDMAADIVRHLYKVLVVQQMINAIGGAIGGPIGNALSTYGQADGGAWQGGSQIQAYADGGVVGSPTLFPMAGGKTGLMGEAGPEAIMPLKRGANGKLGVQMEGGGGDNVVINQSFNFQANGDDSVKKIIAQAAPQIAQMTKNSMLNDRRRGGTTKAVFG